MIGLHKYSNECMKCNQHLENAQMVRWKCGFIHQMFDFPIQEIAERRQRILFRHRDCVGCIVAIFVCYSGVPATQAAHASAERTYPKAYENMLTHTHTNTHIR